MAKIPELNAILAAGTFPRTAKHLKRLDVAVQRYMIGVYAPEQPILTPTDRIACIGSCFAEEIAKSLRAQGKPVIPIFLSERLNTPFAVRYFVEHALEGRPYPPGYMSESLAQGGLAGSEGSARSADAFIVTLGLSICWYRLADGMMVLEPRESHSEKGLRDSLLTHVMKQTSVAENEEQILAIVESIRRIKPGAPIIFSLSPIPLAFSMTDYPVVSSNHISKATLRIALHNVMQKELDNVHYWPSYDIIEWLAKYNGPIFGLDGEDLRHVSPRVIADIMTLFSALFCQPASS